MESISISRSSEVRSGLSAMIEAAIGPNEIVQVFVPMQWALFIVHVAKRAPDKPEWFPRGKWATIQAIEVRIDNELDRIDFTKEHK